MQTARLMAFVSKSFARPEDELRHLRTVAYDHQLGVTPAYAAFLFMWVKLAGIIDHDLGRVVWAGSAFVGPLTLDGMPEQVRRVVRRNLVGRHGKGAGGQRHTHNIAKRISPAGCSRRPMGQRICR